MLMLSFWEKESFYAPQDVIIIGAGLMGLWTALELKKKNSQLRITLLERNTTPLGASTRNAGFACFGSPTELICDAESNGLDRTLELVEMRYKGIQKIRNHFTDEAIGFDPCGGYECINRDYKYWNTLSEKTEWLNKALQPVTGKSATFKNSTEKLTGLGLGGFDCLLENEMEAALHSGKLVQALTQKVQSEGVNILYGVEVTGWEEQQNDVTIHTHTSISFRAGKLILCTNAFTGQLTDAVSVTPARGQIIVTSPIEGLTLKGTFHFDEGFYYWRNLGNRILLGGARNTAFTEEETTDLSGSDKIKNTLIAFLEKHLHPSLPFTIEHHWSGVMGFTANKSPHIGYISNHVLTAIACNGIGVALTPIVAEKVAKLW